MALIPIRIQPGLFIVLFLTVFGAAQLANAAIIDDLYDAKIPVPNQSESIRKKSFTQAIRQVLVKVRGNNDLLSNKQIKNEIVRVKRLVRSYRYEKEQSQLFLLISFDSERVEQVIRDSGYPVWDKRRPDSLIWLAMEQGQPAKKEILTNENAPLIHEQMRLRAKERGIKLVFPIWDLNDRQALNFYDIWGGFSQQISYASERYGLQSTLSARIYSAVDKLDGSKSGHSLNSTSQKDGASSSWLADWTIIESGRLLAGQVVADTQIGIGKKLIDVLTDKLSVRYAVDLNTLNPSDAKVKIVINNIDSISRYANVLTFLQSLSVVESASLISQQGTKATFELRLLGEVDDLKNAISLDRKVQPILDEFGQPITELEFFWVK